MRNLLEYPITLEEQLEALDWAIARAQEHEADSMGGTLVASLQQVRDNLKK
jgi:hypothetical protein